jgi:hypothetical protein
MSADVTRLRPRDAEELLGMVEELTRRVDYLTRTAERYETVLTQYAARLDEHAEALDAHEDRLNTLDDTVAQPQPSDRDRLYAQVTDFVNAHPGIMFTPLTIGGSLGLDNIRIATVLDTLARRGVIAEHRQEGRTRLFSALPAAGGAS